MGEKRYFYALITNKIKITKHMKKYLLSLMTIVMVALASVGFVSCGDDEEEGDGGSKSSGLLINGKYGYYIKNRPTYWEFTFTSVDIYKIKESTKFDYLTISLETTEPYDDIPTGVFEGCFTVDAAKGVSARSEGEYYESGHAKYTTGKLTIKKVAGKYTVSYEGVDLYNDDSNMPTITNASFSYTGTLTEMPSDMFD